MAARSRRRSFIVESVLSAFVAHAPRAPPSSADRTGRRMAPTGATIHDARRSSGTKTRRTISVNGATASRANAQITWSRTRNGMPRPAPRPGSCAEASADTARASPRTRRTPIDRESRSRDRRSPRWPMSVPATTASGGARAETVVGAQTFHHDREKRGQRESAGEQARSFQQPQSNGLTIPEQHLRWKREREEVTGEDDRDRQAPARRCDHRHRRRPRERAPPRVEGASGCSGRRPRSGRSARRPRASRRRATDRARRGCSSL